MILETKATSLVYRDHEKEVFACRDISVHVNEGEFLGILGPSGSGKSSLLYLLSGLKVPTHGEVLMGGQNINSLADTERSDLRLNQFGFVFQQPYLLGYLTALENVLVANPAKRDANAASELLKLLGLESKMDRRPHELSGGERQRVCVARALYGKPRVIFADEPTAALDHSNGANVVNLLASHRGEGALVMVTHDPSMLEKADRILHIVDGQVKE